METVLAQLWQQGWLEAIGRGSVLTIAISIISMLIGTVIGIAGGLIKWANIFPLNFLIDGYTTVVRGVPELLVIYLLFFSSTEFVSRLASSFGYNDRSDGTYPFLIGVVSIGIISGAYAIEVVRGALAEVPHGHIESARALGLSMPRIFRRIIAPQMLRIAIPGINNVWQTTMKDTALISVIGLQELMRISALGAGSTREPLIFYVIAAGVYLCITMVSSTLFGIFERLLNRSFTAVV